MEEENTPQLAASLIVLENGAIIIDNPGLRELGVISNESGLGDTFNEIDALADLCKYKDCTHTVEAGCPAKDT